MPLNIVVIKLISLKKKKKKSGTNKLMKIWLCLHKVLQVEFDFRLILI